MSRLYRFQRRFFLTRVEAHALFWLILLLGVGTGVEYYRRLQALPAASDYAALDSLFLQATASEVSDTPRAEPPPAVPMASGGISINTAPESVLVRLPGIGPRLAGRIVAYREVHGPFRRKEDLLQVRGIGPKTLARLRAMVTLD